MCGHGGVLAQCLEQRTIAGRGGRANVRSGELVEVEDEGDSLHRELQLPIGIMETRAEPRCSRSARKAAFGPKFDINPSAVIPFSRGSIQAAYQNNNKYRRPKE